MAVADEEWLRQLRGLPPRQPQMSPVMAQGAQPAMAAPMAGSSPMANPYGVSDQVLADRRLSSAAQQAQAAQAGRMADALRGNRLDVIQGNSRIQAANPYNAIANVITDTMAGYYGGKRNRAEEEAAEIEAKRAAADLAFDEAQAGAEWEAALRGEAREEAALDIDRDRADAYGADIKSQIAKRVADLGLDQRGAERVAFNPMAENPLETITTLSYDEDIPEGFILWEGMDKTGIPDPSKALEGVKDLVESEAARTANLERAIKLRDALVSGASTGVGDFYKQRIQEWTTGPLDILGGGDQYRFREDLDSFAEQAARQALKAQGDTRPTDADVRGMKASLFGIGKDEETNINLLNSYIDQQVDLQNRLNAARGADPAINPEAVDYGDDYYQALFGNQVTEERVAEEPEPVLSEPTPAPDTLPQTALSQAMNRQTRGGAIPIDGPQPFPDQLDIPEDILREYPGLKNMTIEEQQEFLQLLQMRDQ